MNPTCSRREWLALGPAAGLAAAVAPVGAHAEAPAPPPFRYCLNSSTIRGQKLPLAKVVDLVAEAGYDAIEPWVSEIHDHVKAGGTLDALGTHIRKLGLQVPSAIGFFEWCVDDDGRRKAALEEARRTMEMVREIGGRRVAAPPMGATDVTGIDPARLAERYRALLELGERFEVVPELEVWGFSKTLGTLGEVAQVAVAADHPRACILADVFHLYRGGSGFHGVRQLAGRALPVFHVNDVPAHHPRETIKDSDRVYPGDGVAPLRQLFGDLKANGLDGFLSVELFNPSYYSHEPLDVLRTALSKLRQVVGTVA